jgi:nucleoid-associated protein YgaU
MHPLDTPEPATTPSPALDETTPTPVPPDASDTAAAEGTAAERARPPVTPALSADLHPRARTTARRAPRSGHDTAGDGERDGGSHRVRATSAPDRDDVEHGQPATYTVRPGDSLWRIADRHLGPHATAAATAREVNRLWQINQQRIRTGDPDLIFPGQRLRM